MNSEKLARRKRMGDDPTAGTQSNMTTPGAPPAVNPEQPIPGMPQGKGNMMGNPKIGESMGGGMPQPTRFDQSNPQSAYGDEVFSPDVFGKLGGGGYASRSEIPQNLVVGRKLNSQAYNSVAQPQGETMNIIDGLYAAQQSGQAAKRAYGEMQPPPFQVTPMGMYGSDMDKFGGNVQVAGQIPPKMSGQMQDSLPLQGMPDAQMAAGMAPDDGSLLPGSIKTTFPAKKGGMA